MSQIIDWSIEAQARARQGVLTKPAGSLGRLEELACWFAGRLRHITPEMPRAEVFVFAADHGVAIHGVSAYPQSVTAQMVQNLARGGAAINVLARLADARIEVVDIGVASDVPAPPGVRRERIAKGTADLAAEAAMTFDQLQKAFDIADRCVGEAELRGARLLIAGEMGIGNTTSAACLICALTGASPEDIVGRGTGIDDARLQQKIATVSAALARVNAAKPATPFRALAEVGGFELAAIAGFYVSAARRGIPIVLDGYLSSAAALAAVAIEPESREWMVASHLSTEHGHAAALEALKLEPLFDLKMRLGEGTGAALALSLIRAALALHRGMATFADAGIAGPSTPLEKPSAPPKKAPTPVAANAVSPKKPAPPKKPTSPPAFDPKAEAAALIAAASPFEFDAKAAAAALIEATPIDFNIGIQPPARPKSIPPVELGPRPKPVASSAPKKPFDPKAEAAALVAAAEPSKPVATHFKIDSFADLPIEAYAPIEAFAEFDLAALKQPAKQPPSASAPADPKKTLIDAAIPVERGAPERRAPVDVIKPVDLKAPARNGSPPLKTATPAQASTPAGSVTTAPAAKSVPPTPLKSVDLIKPAASNPSGSASRVPAAPPAPPARRADLPGGSTSSRTFDARNKTAPANGVAPSAEPVPTNTSSNKVTAPYDFQTPTAPSALNKGNAPQEPAPASKVSPTAPPGTQSKNYGGPPRFDALSTPSTTRATGEDEFARKNAAFSASSADTEGRPFAKVESLKKPVAEPKDEATTKTNTLAVVETPTVADAASQGSADVEPGASDKIAKPNEPVALSKADTPSYADALGEIDVFLESDDELEVTAAVEVSAPIEESIEFEVELDAFTFDLPATPVEALAGTPNPDKISAAQQVAAPADIPTIAPAAVESAPGLAISDAGEVLRSTDALDKAPVPDVSGRPSNDAVQVRTEFSGSSSAGTADHTPSELPAAQLNESILTPTVTSVSLEKPVLAVEIPTSDVSAATDLASELEASKKPDATTSARATEDSSTPVSPKIFDDDGLELLVQNTNAAVAVQAAKESFALAAAHLSDEAAPSVGQELNEVQVSVSVAEDKDIHASVAESAEPSSDKQTTLAPEATKEETTLDSDAPRKPQTARVFTITHVPTPSRTFAPPAVAAPSAHNPPQASAEAGKGESANELMSTTGPVLESERLPQIAAISQAARESANIADALLTAHDDEKAVTGPETASLTVSVFVPVLAPGSVAAVAASTTDGVENAEVTTPKESKSADDEDEGMWFSDPSETIGQR